MWGIYAALQAIPFANITAYLGVAPSSFITVLFLGSTERFVRTPHAEKHMSGFLESSSATTNWSTDAQKHTFNFHHSVSNPVTDLYLHLKTHTHPPTFVCDDKLLYFFDLREVTEHTYSFQNCIHICA